MALLAVIGHPISHSASPIMHNAALRALGLPLRYIAIDTRPDQFKRTLNSLHVLGFKGLNITIPHKEAAARLSLSLSEEAEAVSAVNTLRRIHGGWAGYNTDVAGVERSIAPQIEDGAGCCLVLGAGGSAAAALYALWRLGVGRVVLANRSPERAEALAWRFREKLGLDIKVVALGEAGREARKAYIIINATPLGLTYRESPLRPEDLSKNHVILDMVYSPRTTPLQAVAEQAGSKYIDGVKMLVEQGAEAFRIIIGLEPDRALMERAVRIWLARRRDPT
ncbi:MAG: shikimate dehydrogenase [Nitrososphaerota archaeon]